MLEPNGKIYEGKWENGYQSGRGRTIFSDGSCYEGEYIRGFQHGKGKFEKYYPKYHIYEGQFANNYKHGFGVEIMTDGFKYEGKFLNGHIYGKGKLWRLNGTFFEGEFRNGFYHGYGILHESGIPIKNNIYPEHGAQCTDCETLENKCKITLGKFKNSKINGFQIIKNSNGSTSFGKYFLENMPVVGLGVYVDSEGHEHIKL